MRGSSPNNRKLEDQNAKVGVFPPTCSRIECPSYDVMHADANNEFEIRRYNSSVWMSTSPIDDISFLQATTNGFLQLFNYIQGKNEYKKEIEMTAPVLTKVSPSDGPFCASSFTVSFYVPKINQENPPPAKGLELQRWGKTYIAVRQFSGFVYDLEVGLEAAALYTSLRGTEWAEEIDSAESYIVAQYNSPFEFTGRVNEIWMMLHFKDLDM